MGDYGVYLTAAGLFLAIIGAVVKVTLHISGVEKAVMEHTNANVENMERDMRAVQSDATRRIETLTQQTGEMGTALRTKLHEIEVFTRDHFVTRDSFASTMDRFEKSLDTLGDRIEKRLDKFAERMDKLSD